MSDIKDFVIENGVLKKYEGAGGDVVVPDGVIAIGPEAFAYNGTITSVFLPDSVSIIWYRAFAFSRNMAHIRLPNSMELIHDSAFMSCSALVDVEIPTGLGRICQYTFEGCSSLKRIVVPEGISNIEYLAFSFCYDLETVVLPMSVTKDLFAFFKSLRGNHGILKDCNKLSSIVAPGISLKDFSDPKDKLIAVRGYLYERERFTDPDIVASYDQYILSQKKRILPYIFENDLVQWLDLFNDNGKITKKNVVADFIDPAIASNADQCIAFLLNWKNANGGDSENLLSLDESEKPKKPKTKKTENDPFAPEKMTKLWTAKKREDGTLELTKYKKNGKKISIPPRIGKKAVTKLGEELFSSARNAKQSVWASQITEVYIPEGITEIGIETFYGCHKLKLIEIPASIEKIGNGAFFQCFKLSDIVLPEHLTYIGECAFYNCVGLRDLEIPAGVTKIGKKAFRDCYNLIIHAPAGSYAEQYAKENNIPFVAEE